MTDFDQTLTLVRAQIEKALVDKAMDDASFRALLTRDPHAALRQLIGTDPIPSLKISVVEEAPGEVVLVLPRSIAEDELPDELLDMASGGVSFGNFVEITSELNRGRGGRPGPICPR
ncbi:NHLP leader peptide family RiPP precursor [Pannonibacter tanglangensis]|uniref:NHLP leader peptide family RiPP precursor n=1 Tax=Pannonibacter tanglangensis TaxID=2750084 RepID=UPI001AD8F42D|nr:MULTISPECIES: NHLP leader peptide family RiPP precursor [unclassified Pannonibacter]